MDQSHAAWMEQLFDAWMEQLIFHAVVRRLAVAGRTLIRSAVKNGDTETVKDLLDRGVPIDTKGDMEMSLLHLAAQGGHVNTVRLLIRRGCNVDSVDGRGYTPLHCAAAEGHTAAVQELIRNGASKSVVAGSNEIPPDLAACKGNKETAEAMLEAGHPSFMVYTAFDGNPLYFGTALDQAALFGHMETVLAMLEEGCPLKVEDSGGATVLHFAAQGGNVELVKKLVHKGCKVNALEANGWTALHIAAKCGRTEAVRELIKLGATKSVVAGIHGTPLHQAARKGHVETAVAMLEEGCPLDKVDSDGATVLHDAADVGNVELVRELVGRGCDVNAVKANGFTPLHSAADSGRTEAVRELIKLGATKSVVAGNCGTPLHQAARKGHVETAVAMLEEGCPLDVVNSNGASVLHDAADVGNVELVRELVRRGCNVNGVRANGCTPLHYAATYNKTKVVRELIKLGASKSVVAGMVGTPLHRAVYYGHVETVEALLEGELSEPELTSHDATPSNVQVPDSGIIGTCDSLGRTPVMWALRRGQVEVLKLLISKGGAISDRDSRSLCAFEHCFIGGQASNLSQFCQASGIRSSGEGLRGALETLITRGLVDAHKVLCLCAISGDSVFLEDQFTKIVASDACAMPAAVKCAKYCFLGGEGVPFISQLNIPDENALNPLQMALLSLKCYEMGFAIDSVQRGTKDHTSFITKLLSHPVLKKTVHANFPNGLSPLDLAQQFELHHIAALIEGAGGRPGVWAGVPQEIEVRHPLALSRVKEAYASIIAIAEDGEHGQAFIRHLLSSVLREPLGLWHPNAIIVNADVGAERDDHAFKSLRECMCVNEVCRLIDKCNIEINAMLNHHEGGRIHFGIGSNGRVEEGLDFEQNEGIKKVREMVGDVLRKFWHPVDSRFAQVEPVYLLKSREELTGRWRFDIVIKRHPTVVQLARGKSGYYRHGATNVRMTYDVFVEKIRAESACRRVSVWDANAAATVGANVGAERYDHEYKTLIGPVGDVKQPANDENGTVRRVRDDSCRRAINAMLNNPTGGSIHFGIRDNGIVEEGLDPKYKSKAIDGVRKKVGEVLNHFYHPVEVSFVQVEPVDLRNDKQELTGRWRFDIVVKPHPTVVQLSQEETAYYRCGTQNQKMVHHVLAERVRREPAGQLPRGN